jgi:hypothetical protein
MNLKVSESSTQLLIAQTVILRLGYLRLKPELGFTIGGCDMDVHSRFLAGEEVEPEWANPQNRGAHGWILAQALVLGA